MAIRITTEAAAQGQHTVGFKRHLHIPMKISSRCCSSCQGSLKKKNVFRRVGLGLECKPESSGNDRLFHFHVFQVRGSELSGAQPIRGPMEAKLYFEPKYSPLLIKTKINIIFIVALVKCSLFHNENPFSWKWYDFFFFFVRNSQPYELRN